MGFLFGCWLCGWEDWCLCFFLCVFLFSLKVFLFLFLLLSLLLIIWILSFEGLWCLFFLCFLWIIFGVCELVFWLILFLVCIWILLILGLVVFLFFVEWWLCLDFFEEEVFWGVFKLLVVLWFLFLFVERVFCIVLNINLFFKFFLFIGVEMLGKLFLLFSVIIVGWWVLVCWGLVYIREFLLKIDELVGLCDVDVVVVVDNVSWVGG